MELQNFINDNPNYKDCFLREGFKVNKYHDLIIVKYPREYDSFNQNWKYYCRGCVIDTNNHKVVCIPPVKSRDINYDELSNKDVIVENLIDGTMINIFNHNGEWIMATRGEIGCNNKWKSKRSFKQLFYECSPEFQMNDLNENYSYSFVLNHISNRNVSQVYQNTIILVSVYDRNTFESLPLTNFVNPHYDIVYPYDIDSTVPLSFFIDSMKEQSMDHNWKGLTFKVKDGSNYIRYNLKNPKFEEAETISVNSRNKLYIYLKALRNKNIQKHLSIYPEDKYEFDKYYKQLIRLKNDIYKEYVNVHILKTKEKNRVIAKELFNIHGSYLQDKQRITFQKVSTYVDNLSIGRVMYLIRYFISGS